MDETTRLKRTPFDLADLERGEDGELYHLPTLRALHAAGHLHRESAGYRLLLRAAPPGVRMIA